MCSGGALGLMRADQLGPELEQFLRKLPFDKHSNVVKRDSGCFIFMHKRLTEEDILSVLKDLAKNSAKAQAMQEYSNALAQAKKIYY